VTEIWTVLGESGESLRKSLVWAIEAVKFKLIDMFVIKIIKSQMKEKFNKLIDLLNSLRKGESNVHLVGMLDSLRENYDKVLFLNCKHTLKN